MNECFTGGQIEIGGMYHTIDSHNPYYVKVFSVVYNPDDIDVFVAFKRQEGHYNHRLLIKPLQSFLEKFVNVKDWQRKHKPPRPKSQIKRDKKILKNARKIHKEQKRKYK